eukprot:TRINITY_DN2799_c0_g1_i1.p1 TRINITY_DN2799_c0_g1~~TRINITY_DN2799_c0_g1_i1.p1  ORF type:complete len:193 (-),score=28.97 TRINITY_DN2799_c0_g1_i1:102-680(-)
MLQCLHLECKLIDPSYMLGIKREIIETEDEMAVELTMTAFVEAMAEAFQEHLSRVPAGHEHTWTGDVQAVRRGLESSLLDAHLSRSRMRATNQTPRMASVSMDTASCGRERAWQPDRRDGNGARSREDTHHHLRRQPSRYPSLRGRHRHLGVVKMQYIPTAENLADLLTNTCLLYTSPSPRDRTRSRMPSSA